MIRGALRALVSWIVALLRRRPTRQYDPREPSDVGVYASRCRWSTPITVAESPTPAVADAPTMRRYASAPLDGRGLL